MRKNYALILSVGMVMCLHVAQAQTDPETFANLLNVPNVPSPTSSQLAVYANNVVSSFTGVPAIEVPVYEITVGDFKLPISLSYNASGIKVGDVAGWVGTGWSLNAGGVITRTVADRPDDVNPNSSDWGNGFLYYNYNATVATVQSGNIAAYNAGSPGSASANLYWIRDGKIDTEPDLFFFNFGGHTGKFVFSQGDPVNNLDAAAVNPLNHKILLFPYKDIQFSYALNPTGSGTKRGEISSFTAIDEDGNQYLFSDKEDLSSAHHSFDFYNPGGMTAGSSTSYNRYYSSWYLTRITTKLGKIINFTYQPETYTQDFPLNPSVRGLFVNPYLGCSPSVGSGNTASTWSSNTVTGVRLSGIEGDDFKVMFFADENRQDLAGAHALTSMNIYSKATPSSSGTFVKAFDLTYNYLTSPTDPGLDNSTTHGDPNKRLMLSSVSEHGLSGFTVPPYTFAYNNTITLPSRLSAQQDFWGYFNANSCPSLLPTVYIYPLMAGSDRFTLFPRTGYAGTTYTITGANRNANITACVSGTLTRITYPTGGYQDFQYEPNDFFYLGQNQLGGGLRLKQTTLYDGVNHAADIVKTYSYRRSADNTKSSGVLFNLPVFAYTENFFDYWDSNPRSSSNNLYMNPSTLDYFLHYMVISSSPSYSLSGYDGINVGYSEIKETTTGNGSVLTRFSTPAVYGDINDQSGLNCSIAQNGTCDNLFSVTRPASYYAKAYCGSALDSKYYPDTTGLQLTYNSYPFAPKLNYEWNRGLVVSRDYSDAGGNPVKRIENTYSVYSPQSSPPAYVYGLKRNRMSNYHLFLSDCDYVMGLPRFDVVSRYPIITQVAKVLSESKVFQYDAAGSSYAESQRYQYGPNHTLPVKTTVSRSGGELINSYSYKSFDYTLTGTSSDATYLGAKNLKQNHILAPVEEYTEVTDTGGSNPRVIAGNFISYKTTTPQAENLFRLEAATPVTGFVRAALNTTGATKDARYIKQGSVDYYDAHGNIQQITGRGQKVSSVLWGYNQTLPVAEAVNATKDEIAFTSFEEDDPGGYKWLLHITPDDNSLAKTGSNTYSLSAANVESFNYMPAGAYIISFWGSNTSPANYNIYGLNTGGGTVGLSPTLMQQTQPEFSGALGYFQYKITVPASTRVVLKSNTTSSPVDIDELRLYPADARMKTYTYKKMVGVTAVCDENNHINQFEFDNLTRLTQIKDQNRKILKKFVYGIQE